MAKTKVHRSEPLPCASNTRNFFLSIWCKQSNITSAKETLNQDSSEMPTKAFLMNLNFSRIEPGCHAHSLNSHHTWHTQGMPWKQAWPPDARHPQQHVWRFLVSGCAWKGFNKITDVWPHRVTSLHLSFWQKNPPWSPPQIKKSLAEFCSRVNCKPWMRPLPKAQIAGHLNLDKLRKDPRPFSSFLDGVGKELYVWKRITLITWSLPNTTLSVGWFTTI